MISVSNNKFWLFEQSTNTQTALQNSEIKLSYEEFSNLSKKNALNFINLGIKQNDNVGILFSHKIEFWIIVNSLWLIGAVPVPLNTRNTSIEIDKQISKAVIDFLIIDKEFGTNNYSIDPKRILIYDRENFSSINVDASFPEQAEIHSRINLQADRSALILFTSGSSGKSKAVVHTFQSLFESAKLIDSFCNLSKDDIWLASLPLYHIGGFMILVRSLLAGSRVTFPSSLKHDELVTAYQRYHPTHISIVPTTLKRMLEDKVEPGQKVKFVFLGGGPSEAQICQDAFNSGWPIIKVYGSTETCSMIAALPGEELKRKAVSSGNVLGDNRIKIAANNQDEGEIIVQSKALFKEYFNDSELTANKIKDGWFYTGDFGTIDNDGYLFVHARREDLIITGGENVSTREVEEAIKSLDGINEVFVFAIEDDSWGQIVCAAIAGKQLNAETINASLKKKLAGYKIPKRIYFVDQLPKNEMGKIKRDELLSKFKLS